MSYALREYRRERELSGGRMDRREEERREDERALQDTADEALTLIRAAQQRAEDAHDFNVKRSLDLIATALLCSVYDELGSEYGDEIETALRVMED